ncbi:MAG: PorT family protein, partial [Bacteroidetes bacterium]
KYKFNNHFYIEAGPQFGLMYNAWVEYNSNVDGKDARVKEYNEGMLKRIDVGVLGGFGFQAAKGKGIQYGIKYYYGFIDTYKEKSGTKNSAIFLKVNIPIGAGEKEKKTED